jgi:hypothetical protein
VSRASLAIEDPFVILRPSGIRDEYAIEVRFLLKETGGDSGATIEQIGLSDQRGGGEVIGGSCTRGLRVLPGGVLDTYYTDESVKALSYCGPYLGSVGAPTPNLLVDVSVTFLDDDGRRGWADAQASVR